MQSSNEYLYLSFKEENLNSDNQRVLLKDRINIFDDFFADFFVCEKGVVISIDELKRTINLSKDKTESFDFAVNLTKKVELKYKVLLDTPYKSQVVAELRDLDHILLNAFVKNSQVKYQYSKDEYFAASSRADFQALELLLSFPKFNKMLLFNLRVFDLNESK